MSKSNPMHHHQPEPIKVTPTCVRLPWKLRAKLGRMALHQHRTLSNLIIHILEGHLKEIENEN